MSLPDELADRVRNAAGGEGQVSAYVATALADYQERESLDEVLAAWQLETPAPEDVRQQVITELDQVGLRGPSRPRRRRAG